LAALVLLSLANFAVSSYELIGIYSQDPNGTLAQQSWFHKWPSFLTGTSEPIYQPSQILVDTEFKSNNTALTYKLTNAYQIDENGMPQSQGSIPYYNN
jgi:hypothetical protein